MPSLGRRVSAATPTRFYRLTKEELDRVVQLLTKGSLYALEEELRNGYITLPGGHRVGLVGQAGDGERSAENDQTHCGH